MMKILKLRALFSQLKKQQIINSSYDQLVQRVARNYNLKQYKNQSGLCLLQMHHQFKLFNSGDWVLDVGSSPQYAWTDLALKLTANTQSSNKVISNDILDLRKNRQNNVFIQGDINSEPVQTKIALQLQNKNLDTILVDVSPQFTGNINNDGRSIMYTVSNVMNIAQSFLKKGGNFVCKVLESQSQKLLYETFSIYFNQKYKYIPSIIRKTSPVCFYVMKGYLMSESYHALNQFLQNYKGSNEKKMKLVQKYQGKYSWDPIKVIKKKILNQVVRMRQQGRSDKDIIKVFSSDPYFKVQKTLKLFKQAEQAQKSRNMILKYKIMNQITQGDLYKNSEEIPTTFDQFYQGVLQNMDKIIKEDKQKKAQRKFKVSRAPLKENQVYMKVEDKVQQKEEIEKEYLYGDLHGKYSQRMSKEDIDLETQKITKIHPEITRLMGDLEQASKDTSQKTIEQILQQNKKKYEDISEQSLRNIQQAVEQSVRKMSQQDLQQQKKLQKEIFRTNLNEQTIQKSDRWVNQRRSRRKKPLF